MSLAGELEWDCSRDIRIGLTPIFDHQRHKTRATQIKAKAELLKGKRIGLYIVTGDRHTTFTFNDLPNIIADQLRLVGIFPVYLQPDMAEAKAVAADLIGWQNAMLMGQDVDLVVLGRAATIQGRRRIFHWLELTEYLPNGFELYKLANSLGEQFQPATIEEQAGFRSSYQNLADRAVLQILKSLAAVETLAVWPDPSFRHDPNRWPLDKQASTLEANHDRLRFGGPMESRIND